tara:strand:- start:166 stop:606 length:441 start_codon:yes stop_codon:yes gene_type:complete
MPQMQPQSSLAEQSPGMHTRLHSKSSNLTLDLYHRKKIPKVRGVKKSQHNNFVPCKFPEPMITGTAACIMIASLADDTIPHKRAKSALSSLNAFVRNARIVASRATTFANAPPPGRLARFANTCAMFFCVSRGRKHIQESNPSANL